MVRLYTSLDQKLLPPKLVKGLGRYDIPTMLLARLAVDRSEQGQGLGKALLKDAVLRTIQAAEIAGLKLLLVHAKDASASNSEARVRTRCQRSPAVVLANPSFYSEIANFYARID